MSAMTIYTSIIPQNKQDYFVYELRLSESQFPFYIGKGRDTRHLKHFCPSLLKIKSHKNNIIKKAQSEGTEILATKLHKNIDESTALSLEIWYIYKYGRIDIKTGCLANHTNGGEGVSTVSPYAPIDTRSKEQRSLDRIKLASINIKKYNSTRVITPEIRQNMSNSQKGRIPSVKARLAASFRHSGTKNNNYGKYPWETARCQKIHKDIVWFNADTIFDTYNAGFKTYTKLSTKLKIERHMLVGIVKKFDEGWNPYEDRKWLDWKSSYGFSNYLIDVSGLSLIV